MAALHRLPDFTFSAKLTPKGMNYGLFHNQGTHLSLTGGQKYTCQNVFDFCTHFKQTVWRNYPENFRACGSLVPEL